MKNDTLQVNGHFHKNKQFIAGNEKAQLKLHSSVTWACFTSGHVQATTYEFCEAVSKEQDWQIPGKMPRKEMHMLDEQVN